MSLQNLKDEARYRKGFERMTNGIMGHGWSENGKENLFRWFMEEIDKVYEESRRDFIEEEIEKIEKSMIIKTQKGNKRHEIFADGYLKGKKDILAHLQSLISEK